MTSRQPPGIVTPSAGIECTCTTCLTAHDQVSNDLLHADLVGLNLGRRYPDRVPHSSGCHHCERQQTLSFKPAQALNRWRLAPIRKRSRSPSAHRLRGTQLCFWRQMQVRWQPSPMKGFNATGSENLYADFGMVVQKVSSKPGWPEIPGDRAPGCAADRGRRPCFPTQSRRDISGRRGSQDGSRTL